LKYFIELPKGKATVFLLHLEETLLMHYGSDDKEVRVINFDKIEDKAIEGMSYFLS